MFVKRVGADDQPGSDGEALAGGPGVSACHEPGRLSLKTMEVVNVPMRNLTCPDCTKWFGDMRRERLWEASLRAAANYLCAVFEGVCRAAEGERVDRV